MKNKILYMLAAVLMGCGLLCFCGCKDEARQLEAAIEAVNKQFPQVIADGATLNGFYTTDFDGQKAVDIRVTLDEAKMIRAIDSLRIAQMKDDLINTFTIATRQDENLRALFALIAANHRALTLTIVQQPSGKEQRVEISTEQVGAIVDSPSLSNEELHRRELQRFIESQQQMLPLVQGPLTCTEIKLTQEKGVNVVTWKYEADETAININALNANAEQVKAEVLAALSTPGNVHMLRTLTDNGCNIRYQYVGSTTGTPFNLDITTQEMLQAIRDANSTTIK